MILHFIQTKKVLYYFTVAIILVATVFVCGVLTTASVKADSGNGQYLLAQTSPVTELDKAANMANLKNPGSLGTQVGTIINGVLSFLGVVLLILFLYGGFVWMTAGGNEEKVRQANKILTSAVVGFVIVFMSYAITNFVAEKFFPVYSTPPGIEICDPEDPQSCGDIIFGACLTPVAPNYSCSAGSQRTLCEPTGIFYPNMTCSQACSDIAPLICI